MVDQNLWWVIINETVRYICGILFLIQGFRFSGYTTFKSHTFCITPPLEYDEYFYSLSTYILQEVISKHKTTKKHGNKMSLSALQRKLETCRKWRSSPKGVLSKHVWHKKVKGDLSAYYEILVFDISDFQI